MRIEFEMIMVARAACGDQSLVLRVKGYVVNFNVIMLYKDTEFSILGDGDGATQL